MRVGNKGRNKRKETSAEAMRIVDKSEKGINLKLNPKLEDRIFTDLTDDGKHLFIVKGVIVRVDELSEKVREVLNRKGYVVPGGDESKKEALLVETDDDPTSPLVDPQDSLSVPSITLAQTIEAAKRYGFTLSVEDGTKTVVRPDEFAPIEDTTSAS